MHGVLGKKYNRCTLAMRTLRAVVGKNETRFLQPLTIKRRETKQGTAWVFFIISRSDCTAGTPNNAVVFKFNFSFSGYFVANGRFIVAT
jgi:hypothetical protein